MSARLLLRSVLVLALLAAAVAAAVPARAASPFDADRASDGAMPGAMPGAMVASPRANPSWLRGIDVSHYNGSIGWNKVANEGGKSFAIMKATEGRSYVDPTYADNRSGALAAGLVVTAYHFARPDRTNGDARAEADHFVNVAGIGVGDIIPALDLERTGGLSHKALVAWVWDFVREVQRRTRVRPMIYTGYFGWQDRTGDTQAFADAGYKLWVANWYVQSPSVPANDWGGHGWTFWQYTDRGNVPGMSGPVDLDYFGGSSIGPVRIPLESATTNGVGTVTSKPLGINCGTKCSAVFDPGSTVTLTATPDAGAVLVDWQGPCTGSLATCQFTAIGSRTAIAQFGYTLTTHVTGLGQGQVTSSSGGITCDESTGAVCAANFVAGDQVTLTATAESGSQFQQWTGGGSCDGTQEYTCQVTMNQATDVTATFADDTPPTPTFHDPRTLSGGLVTTFDEPVHQVTTSNLVLRTSGASSDLGTSVTCADDRGREVSCTTGNVVKAVTQPTEPLIPGETYDVIANPAGVSPPIMDRAGNAAVQQAPESFRAETSLEERSLPTGWTWSIKHDRNASGGSYSHSDEAGAAAVLRFVGGPVTWHTLRGPGAGWARVSIDGRGRGTFQLGAPRQRFAAYRFAGLGSGEHTIRVEVVRGGRAGVAVDGFDVGGARVPDGDVQYRWASHHAGAASGGAFASTDDRGASLRFQFRGTSIRWVTMRGPDQGRAAVYLDGKPYGTYDDYAAARTFGVSRTIAAGSDAVHTLRIVVLGTARHAATGANVSVDAFEIS